MGDNIVDISDHLPAVDADAAISLPTNEWPRGARQRSPRPTANPEIAGQNGMTIAHTNHIRSR